MVGSAGTGDPPLAERNPERSKGINLIQAELSDLLSGGAGSAPLDSLGPSQESGRYRQAGQTRFDSLVEWSESHGGKLHPSLEIYNDPVTKYSIRVKPSADGDGAGGTLQPGFRAITCPLATTLSYLNALVDGPILDATTSPAASPKAGAFPPSFIQSVPPHVLGRFFLIKEYLKREDSFWWPYLATLPSPDQIASWLLPAFWPDDDVAYLEGTNAHVAIEEMQANVKAEFKQARKLLKDEDFPNVAAYSSLMYKWAFAIFTSRSFRPSLMLSDTTKQHLSTLLPQDVQLDDFSILQPLLDIANHSPTAQYTWETSSTPDACTLVCGDSYPPGAQVYNNYGLKTNSELLLGYGFILPPTPALHNDYVHVRKGPQPSKYHNPSDGDQDFPKSFLVSLRPAAHRSSVVCRSRHVPRSDGYPVGLSAFPCFAHFEPALLDDMSAAFASPKQVRLTDRWVYNQMGRRMDTRVETEEPPPLEVADFVVEMKGLLGRKMQHDYQRLMEVGLGADEEGEGEEAQEGGLPPPRTANQRLAATYRRQYADVLEAALNSLAGDDRGAALVVERGYEGAGSA
ncbi:hypothetical protein B0I37DRAFT_356046 [Chaetomium sp. MPI-CAGE-AT-0009]|nr:hypothetical protein B0I37DRAFT_356046 [Chaetomium sp. MPI-CAGE-AT-0009]